MSHSRDQIFTPYSTALCVRTQRVDVVNTFRVSAGRLALFRVLSRTQLPRFAGQADSWTGFDSVQLHTFEL